LFEGLFEVPDLFQGSLLEADAPMHRVRMVWHGQGTNTERYRNSSHSTEILPAAKTLEKRSWRAETRNRSKHRYFKKDFISEKLAAHFRKFWRSEDLRNINSSHSTEILPTVQKFCRQYRNSSHSTEVLPTVQKFFPQYRNSSRSTAILPTIQNSARSTEILPAVQKFFPQYRNSSHNTEILTAVLKFFSPYRSSSLSTEILPAV